MKNIIDHETGEIVQIEEDNEIAERKLREVGAITENTADFIEQYLAIKEQYEMFRYVLEKAMTENGIKSWNNDQFVASIKEETTRFSFDLNAFKKDYPDIYNKYQQISTVKPSLSIRFKGK